MKRIANFLCGGLLFTLGFFASQWQGTAHATYNQPGGVDSSGNIIAAGTVTTGGATPNPFSGFFSCASSSCTLAANKNLVVASGTSTLDYSSSSGSWAGPTGLTTFNGDVVPVAGKAIQIGAVRKAITATGQTIPPTTRWVDASSSGGAYTATTIGDGPSDADVTMVVTFQSVSGTISVPITNSVGIGAGMRGTASGANFEIYWSYVSGKWNYMRSSYPTGIVFY